MAIHLIPLFLPSSPYADQSPYSTTLARDDLLASTTLNLASTPSYSTDTSVGNEVASSTMASLEIESVEDQKESLGHK